QAAAGGSGDGFITRIAAIPGIRISTTTLGVVESTPQVTTGAGRTIDSYTVVLDSQPTADVPVTIDPGSQLTVNQTQNSTSPLNLIFNAGNWNTPQTVTVWAVDDSAQESLLPNQHTGTLTHTVSSGDADYNSTGLFAYSYGGTSNQITFTNTITGYITDN